jgi:hypothetical protein
MPITGPPCVEPDEIAPGTLITGFDIKVPCSADVCNRQVAANLSRGLPDALAPRRSLTVIANGPSALDVDLHAIAGPTLALNGSIALFVAQGLAPTFWACCDPQAVVASLLPDCPPRDTVYFVAAKCHPSVFEKLKDRDVRVWHLPDYPSPGKQHVVLASTVTISATWLMNRLGFTDFTYWGWDGCFFDKRHHASDASDRDEARVMHLSYGGVVQDDEVIGGRTFATTRSWVCEAAGAEQMFQLARYFDITLTLKGDGMFACAQKHILAD